MTTDQTAQLDLLIARIAFHKKVADMYIAFLNQDWPEMSEQVRANDQYSINSFRSVIQVFGEYHLTMRLQLTEELKMKRNQFAIEGGQGTQGSGL